MYDFRSVAALIWYDQLIIPDNVPRYYLLSHFPVEAATRASVLLIPSSDCMSSREDNHLAVGRFTCITAVVLWMYVALLYLNSQG